MSDVLEDETLIEVLPVDDRLRLPTLLVAECDTHGRYEYTESMQQWNCSGTVLFALDMTTNVWL